jgi:hypothetical protein
MKKIIYFVMAAALVCGCAKDEGGGGNSATKIHGTVVVSGEPVNAAAILLTPGGGVKITGSDGMYEFADLEPGKYELKVFKEGFQSFNQSIDVASGKDAELVVTLTRGAGNLSINKSYVDMGSNESNNVAGFSVLNAGSAELAWSVTNAARWITTVDPTSGTVTANSAAAVVFTIDRSKLSSNTADNYATLVVRSTTSGDGSTAELLVTVFGTGDGTNTTIGSNDDYIVVGDLYVQTKDLGGRMDWVSANNSCENSTVGGFDDWYLPNISDLGTLYAKKEAIGGFVTDGDASYYGMHETGYWSSNTYSSGYYYWMSFYNGTQDYDIKNSSNNNLKYRCRCVRKASPLPEVTTLPATNVTANAATLNGRIDKKGEPACTERGFVYSSTFANPDIDDDEAATTKKIVSGTSTDFSANVSGLTTETTYYVRAYATNNNGTVYGASVSFKPVVLSNYVVVLEADGIMVQKNDISSGASWSNARDLCISSNVAGYNDWRLPTVGECSTMFSKKSQIEGFSSSAYWTASDGTAYNFGTGNTGNYYSYASLRVRCVRTLP